MDKLHDRFWGDVLHQQCSGVPPGSALNITTGGIWGTELGLLTHCTIGLAPG